MRITVEHFLRKSEPSDAPETFHGKFREDYFCHRSSPRPTYRELKNLFTFRSCEKNAFQETRGRLCPRNFSATPTAV